MTIYLLRHAIAVSRGTEEYPGDDRPLTPRGISKMKRNAAGMCALRPELDAVLHSPLARSRDTALIVVHALQPDCPVICTDALLPGAGPEAILGELAALNAASVLLVGHEPHLGLLAAELLGTERPSAILRKGGLMKIECGLAAPRMGRIAWLLAPRQLRILGKRG